jgi:hypothetical protein
MSIVQEIVAEAAIGVGIADQPEALSVIHKRGCAAAIWRRQPLPDFQGWIDDLEPELLPRTRMIIHPEAAFDALGEVCDLAGTPDGPEREWLINDTAALATLFAELFHAPYLRLRYDVVTTNACRKFHIDAVTTRLVCTYRGTGTQYGIPVDGGEPRRVFTTPTGAPILLRGTLWPEDPRSGLLHRSPPIEGTAETRLVLVLDPVVNPDDEPDREFLHEED